jgi:hypothetical protein
MLTLADMVHFFAHKLAGLGAWRLSRTLILAGTPGSFSSRHNYSMVSFLNIM